MRLKAYVHLMDANGVVHAFAPGDGVPAWARSRITNPDAWDDDGPSKPEPPPRHGAGSGRDAWAAHAEHLGVEVSDDDSRDDIIAAVER